ncbi:MAG: ABC-F family ATP-binding cassette domain-containing protein [Alphaproteobacteria bacterium]|nr:ABC-F family ATP-binding cassette domain-containing protein [Alphaproteobacteria bacterium]
MIRVENLSLSFGDQVIFDHCEFDIKPGERIGLVGQNGTGKSTLLKILIEQIEPEECKITKADDYQIGYLEQHINFSKNTILEEGCLGLREEDQYDSWKVEKILSGLGFSTEDFDKDPRTFSGGFQVRLNLAKVLAGEPDLLLLDEPTNYLDILSIRWLVSFLKKWERSLILITHDRHIMNSITTHTMAVHRQKIRKIQGDTVKLYDQIADEEELQAQTYNNAMKKRQKTEEYINRFRAKASLASLVQSKIKKLAKENIGEELRTIKSLGFSFNSAEFRAKHMMKVEHISFGYTPEKQLIKDFSMIVHKEDRIGIIGKNGQGKSTLLSLLAGEQTPNEGVIEDHIHCQKGYFGQTNIERLDPNLTVADAMQEANLEMSYSEIRKVCGAMMFSGDNALKKIQVLSGGEKSRVSLGKILLHPVNFLLLDEPTNHLDMESCDALIGAIDNFDGAVAIVTHNEMFLHHLATRLIVFDGGKVFLFEGSYQEFLDKIGWEK